MVSTIKFIKNNPFIALWLVLSFSIKAQTKTNKDIQSVVFKVTMVMLHDVVNPPAASRFYAYSLLGAQAIIAKENDKIASPNSLIKHFPNLTIEAKTPYNPQLASLYCILETAKLLLPSGFQLETEQLALKEQWKKSGYSDNIIQESITVAQQVGSQIITWAKKDGYLKLSTLRRYRPSKNIGLWYPTPPAYMEAVEPNWHTIRPLTLDTCSQFQPKLPIPFSSDSSSTFFGLMQEVYKIGNTLTEEQKTIAAFWDCNPFAINNAGHLSIGFKKISPGGHWINITAIACEKTKLNFEQSILVHGIVATTLMDAFIACWDEKYRSNRIRPETAINQFVNVRWQPLLQTPPFPEYTSGHSVISSATAEILTYFLGDKISYIDDSEVYFDLKPRKFSSFRQAATEASISRLFGGIHFRDAIENGQIQGKTLGNFIIEKLKKAQIATFQPQKPSN